jgi:hypothetical protein
VRVIAAAMGASIPVHQITAGNAAGVSTAAIDDELKGTIQAAVFAGRCARSHNPVTISGWTGGLSDRRSGHREARRAHRRGRRSHPRGSSGSPRRCSTSALTPPRGQPLPRLRLRCAGVGLLVGHGGHHRPR